MALGKSLEIIPQGKTQLRIGKELFTWYAYFVMLWSLGSL